LPKWCEFFSPIYRAFASSVSYEHGLSGYAKAS